MVRLSVAVSLLVICLAWALAAPCEAAADYGRYNLRTGQLYLDKHAKEEGVVVLPSGLQYKVLEAGSGTRKPTTTDTVSVHYRGETIQKKVFDSSYDRGEPAQFGVGGVIAGWTEALQLMVEGDVWELVIPSQLAYGTSGAGADIGPNAVLIFKVELLKIM